MSNTEVAPKLERVEPRLTRARRHGHRAALHTVAIGLVATLVALIALVGANTRQVRLSWVVGTTHASLIWIILASAVLGWLAGLLTSTVLSYRTRRHSEAL